MLWVCSPCPAPKVSSDIPQGILHKSQRGIQAGDCHRQVSSLPAGKLLLSRARWKPKVMEVTVTAEWQCSVLGWGNTLQWHQLPKNQKCPGIILFTTGDIFSESCCNTMNVLYKCRKSKFLLQLNQRHQGDLQGMLFKNIFHNFKDFCLFVKPLLKSPSQLLHPKSRIYISRCPEKPSFKAGVWTWCPIFTFGTGKSLKNCCFMQTSKNPNTATTFDNGWISLVFARRSWWWTLHHQHSPPAEKREHQSSPE